MPSSSSRSSGSVSAPGRLIAIPSAIVAPVRRVERVARAAVVQRLCKRRARPRLHAHELHLRVRATQRDPDPAREPAAADRHDHAREVGHVLEQLERERRLARDHVEVVERVHERGARRLGSL